MQDGLVFVPTCLSRPRHLPHEADAVAILPIFEPECLRAEVELRGIAISERQDHRAVLYFGRDGRESMFRYEHVLEHGALEFGVMSDGAPFMRITSGFEKGC